MTKFEEEADPSAGGDKLRPYKGLRAFDAAGCRILSTGIASRARV
jgi:hypothetical protein